MLFKTIFFKWEDARDLSRRTRRVCEVFGYAPLDQETREVQGSSRNAASYAAFLFCGGRVEVGSYQQYITRSITYHGAMGGLDHT